MKPIPEESPENMRSSAMVVERLVALEKENSELRNSLSILEARLPPMPRDGWICAKDAAAISGFSVQRIYQLVERNKIKSIRRGGTVLIDQNSIPTRSRKFESKF